MYENLDLRNDRKESWALYENIFFMVRRVIFVLNILCLSGYPQFQVTLFLVISQAKMIYTGWSRPKKDPSENRMDLYDNFSLLLIASLVLTFTDWVSQSLSLKIIDYMLITCVVQNLAVVLVKAAISPLIKLKLFLKACLTLRKANKT